MNVNNASVAQLLSNVNQTQNTQANQPAQPGAAPAPAGLNAAAVYEAANSAQNPSNANFQVDTARVQELWSNHQQQVESFRRMVESLLNKQAERQGLAEGWSIRDIEVTPEMRAEAQEMVGEGGYYSVEETASRILDFAVAISGGDPSKIGLLERAVQSAFRQTERMFGEELPEITKQTHAAVMEGFAQWREGGTSAIALLNRKTEAGA